MILKKGTTGTAIATRGRGTGTRRAGITTVDIQGRASNGRRDPGAASFSGAAGTAIAVGIIDQTGATSTTFDIYGCRRDGPKKIIEIEFTAGTARSAG
jgi:hypothetical protein